MPNTVRYPTASKLVVRFPNGMAIITGHNNSGPRTYLEIAKRLDALLIMVFPDLPLLYTVSVPSIVIFATWPLLVCRHIDSVKFRKPTRA